MVQIVEQTHDEKVEMYKKCTKLELIEMLISCNLHLEAVTKQLHIPVVGGPGSDVRSDGEQLGNEGSAKSVRVDECDHNPIEDKLGFYYCSKCRTLL